MGLSDQDLEEYAAQGVYIPSLRHVPGFKFEEQSSFYQRKKESNVRVQSDKDELWICLQMYGSFCSVLHFVYQNSYSVLYLYVYKKWLSIYQSSYSVLYFCVCIALDGWRYGSQTV